MPDTPYFTVEEFRARYPDITEAKKSDDQVEAARAIAEQAFEDAAGRAFVPRTVTETLRSPNGSSAVRANHPGVTEVTTATDADGDDIDITTLAIDGSWLTIDDGWPLDLGAVTIEYTYGATEPPLRVKQAVMLLTRSWLLEGPIDKRATQLAVEGGGSINLATPGLLGSTFGIPEVDATLAQYGAPMATMS